MSERIRLVRGACPLPNEIVSLSIRMKTTPTKMVTSRERIAPGLMCSTTTHQLADRTRSRREQPGGRPPEEMAEHDPNKDGDHKREARDVVRAFAEVVGDRLVVGKEGPGFEDQEEEDCADNGGDQEGEEVTPGENNRAELISAADAGPELTLPLDEEFLFLLLDLRADHRGEFERGRVFAGRD